MYDNRFSAQETENIQGYFEVLGMLDAVLAAYAADPCNDERWEAVPLAIKYFLQTEVPSRFVEFFRAHGCRYAYSRR